MQTGASRATYLRKASTRRSKRGRLSGSPSSSTRPAQKNDVPRTMEYAARVISRSASGLSGSSVAAGTAARTPVGA